MTRPLVQHTIQEISSLVRTREVSPVEVTDAYLARIKGLNGRLNAYISVLEVSARSEAGRAEAEIARGAWRGHLHGVPVGVKDLFEIEGVGVTAGSRLLSGHVAAFDSTAVSRLRDAGAVVLGTLNMDEFAFRAAGENPFYGDVHNPWDLDRTTGGSSGGSGAAVAASLCAAALGTDTGGSVRIPASFCGVVGLKPTYGRISCHGVVPLASSLDHVGVFARSVVDAALMLEVLAGEDSQNPSTRGPDAPVYSELAGVEIDKLRIGIPRNFPFDGADREVEALVRDAVSTLEGQGAAIVEVSLPEAASAWKLNAIMEIAEAAVYHEPYLKTQSMKYSREVRRLLRAGQRVVATEYIKAQYSQELIRQELARVFETVDVLALPTTPFAAPVIGAETVNIRVHDERVDQAVAWLVCPFNQAGLPAISLPCGFTSNGLPVGLQIAGRPWDEPTVLRVAYIYESVTQWKDRSPNLP